MSIRSFAPAVLATLLLPGLAPAAGAPRPRPRAPDAPLWVRLIPPALRKVEAVQMTVSILRREPMRVGAGWFHPSRSSYDWKWLAGRMDADRDGVITRREFKGPAELFDRLDRDGDGRLTPADFDWSERSPWVRQSRAAGMLFRRADVDTNGRISAAEWQALFKKAARGKDHLTPEDLRALLYPPPPPRRPGKRPEAGMPPRWLLLAGLFRGEIGSLREGPRLGEMAPDFRLQTQDGKRTIRLSDYRGKKPVVLIFGSFT
jgi:hypothetical protein